MRRAAAFLTLAIFLAGCASTKGPNGEDAVDFCTHPVEGVPALCFVADVQARQLVARGGECCQARWENITVSVSGDSKCQIVTPGQGLIVTGDRISVLGDGADCNVKLAYNGVLLGYWGFGPKAEQAAQAALSRTWTGEAKVRDPPKPTTDAKPTSDPKPTTDPKATPTPTPADSSPETPQNKTVGDGK